MSSDLRTAIESTIESNDDGDGAPLGRVVEAVATEYGIGQTLLKTHELYVNGELYTPGDCRLKTTRNRGDALLADGGGPFGYERAESEKTPEGHPDPLDHLEERVEALEYRTRELESHVTRVVSVLETERGQR